MSTTETTTAAAVVTAARALEAAKDHAEAIKNARAVSIMVGGDGLEWDAYLEEAMKVVSAAKRAHKAAKHADGVAFLERYYSQSAGASVLDDYESGNVETRHIG